jgi:hypothetical protein
MLFASFLVLVAGCGGGGKNSSATTSSPAGTRTRTVTLQNTTTSISAPTFASAKNCQALAGIAAKAAAAIEASGNATDVLKTEAAEMQALAQEAPSDIRGDFQTFSTAFSGFLQALQNAGYKLGSKTPPTAAQALAFAKAAKSFNTPKLKQAALHLQAWARQNCKGVHTGG